ncbi:PilZ domain-containing protein [Thermodesulfobacterium hveragerdense]|uniref:PilZ domain-containing protein n=1 Tax=Thermodesulfobacterium hveragerdense TaxID=53424 RepID=UPI000413BFEB|nr:PilZ domain-containing protein [Thermodesulfobacterium hveragerdense]
MEREAVRIDVIIPLEVTKLDPSEIENRIAHVVGDTSIFSYIPIKDTIDEALNSWLKLINAKLDYLINLMSREKEGFNNLPYKKVNLSEKGLRFISQDPFEINDFVEVKTVLDLYQPVGFYLYGKVVRCKPVEGKFEVAVEFVNLNKTIREKISFFILQKEREIIREMREI